jgi:hypothetical protein
MEENRTREGHMTELFYRNSGRMAVARGVIFTGSCRSLG